MTVEWRAMMAGDLPTAFAMSKIVHPAYPEDFAVLAEKFRLFPAGCFFLKGVGYCVSHPWGGAPPALNRFLGRLPERAALYYIHDVALLPAVRHTGQGRKIVMRLKAVAGGLGVNRLGLVAVNGSAGFWQRQGFAISATCPPEKLATYGGEARYMECRM